VLVERGLLESWNIPPAIRTAVRRHHDARFEGQDDALAAVVSCADLVARKLGASLEPDPDVSILDAPAARLLRLDDVKVAALVVDVEDDLARPRAA
jgi:HD-like signal output (HDOD) protein